MSAPEVVTRHWWVHPINRNCKTCGEFKDVVLELRKFSEQFHNYFWMSIQQFDDLLHQLLPLIKKQHTNYHRPVSPAERLAVCLR